MSGHLSDEELVRYRQRLMSPTELLLSNDHIAGCASCYERSGGDLHLRVAFNSARAAFREPAAAFVDHLTYEQLASYVDQNLPLDALKRVEPHLAVCPRCETDAADLIRVKETLESHAEQPERVTVEPKHRSGAVWRFAGSRFAMQAAAGLLIAIVAGWVATIPLRTEIRDARESLQNQQAALEQLQLELSDLRGQNTALAETLKDSEDRIAEMAASMTGRTGAPDSLVAISAPISINDKGQTIGLDLEGKLSGVARASESDARLVREALAAGVLRTPPLINQLAVRGRSIMSPTGAGAFSLLRPVATLIETDRPTFEWRELPGATSYSVGVFDSAGNEIASSPALTSTAWTITKPLARGRAYIWQVRAIKDGAETRLPRPEDGDAKFAVLGAAELRKLDEARKLYAGSHLMMGLFYARAGLLDDCEKEFEALARDNPGSREVERMLRKVKAIRRR